MCLQEKVASVRCVGMFEKITTDIYKKNYTWQDVLFVILKLKKGVVCLTNLSALSNQGRSNLLSAGTQLRGLQIL